MLPRSLTPFGLRARARRWLLKHLVGVDLSKFDAAAREPAPLDDKVEPVPDDTPFLGKDAMSFVAGDPASPAPASPEAPLKGSVEERLARFKL